MVSTDVHGRDFDAQRKYCHGHSCGVFLSITQNNKKFASEIQSKHLGRKKTIPNQNVYQSNLNKKRNKLHKGCGHGHSFDWPAGPRTETSRVPLF